MGTADDLSLAVAHNLFVGNVDTQSVQLLDDSLGAGNSLLREILKFHVQRQVRGVAVVAQNVNVLTLPHGRNFNARDNFEANFFGRFYGQVVAVQVVVVGNGYAAESLALAKDQQFFDGKVSIREFGVHVEVRIATAFGNDGGIPFLHYLTP